MIFTGRRAKTQANHTLQSTQYLSQPKQPLALVDICNDVDVHWCVHGSTLSMSVLAYVFIE